MTTTSTRSTNVAGTLSILGVMAATAAPPSAVMMARHSTASNFPLSLHRLTLEPMTAAADDEDDWVGIKRPGGPTRVIGALSMRPAQDLVEAVDEVKLTREDRLSRPGRSVALLDGELAALKWVLGDITPAPMSGHTDVDIREPRNLDRERRIATDMLRRQVEMDPRGDGYVAGVEMTLMWILNETDNAPG